MDYTTKNKQITIKKAEVMNLIKEDNLDSLYKASNRQGVVENNRRNGDEMYTVDRALHDNLLIGYALKNSSQFKLEPERRMKLFSVRNRNTAQILLNSKRYRKDSPEMARVKEAVKKVEQKMDDRIFEKIKGDHVHGKLDVVRYMDNYVLNYQDAIVACKDYLKDKSPITKKGIERYQLVKATMENLLEEINVLSYAKQMVFRGKIGEKNYTLKDIILDARKNFQVNGKYTDQEKTDFASLKSRAYEDLANRVEKKDIEDMKPELRLFFEAITFDVRPDMLVGKAGKNKEDRKSITNFLISLRNILANLKEGEKNCISLIVGDTVVNIFQRENGALDINYCYWLKGSKADKYATPRQKLTSLNAKYIAHNIGLNMIENEKLFGKENTAKILREYKFTVEGNVSEMDKARSKEIASAYLRTRLGMNNTSLTNIPSGKLLEWAREMADGISSPADTRAKIANYENIELKKDKKESKEQETEKDKEEALKKTLSELEIKAKKYGFENMKKLDEIHRQQEISEEQKQEELEREQERKLEEEQKAKADKGEQANKNADAQEQNRNEEEPEENVWDEAYTKAREKLIENYNKTADNAKIAKLKEFESRKQKLDEELKRAERRLQIFDAVQKNTELDDEALKTWLTEEFNIDFWGDKFKKDAQKDEKTAQLIKKDIEEMKNELLSYCNTLDNKQRTRNERIDEFHKKISVESQAIIKRIDTEISSFKLDVQSIDVWLNSRLLDLPNELETFRNERGKDIKSAKNANDKDIDGFIQTDFENWLQGRLLAAQDKEKKEQQDEMVAQYRQAIGDLNELRNSVPPTLTDLRINGQDTLELLSLRQKYKDNGTLKEKVIYKDEYEYNLEKEIEKTAIIERDKAVKRLEELKNLLEDKEKEKKEEKEEEKKKKEDKEKEEEKEKEEDKEKEKKKEQSTEDSRKKLNDEIEDLKNQISECSKEIEDVNDRIKRADQRCKKLQAGIDERKNKKPTGWSTDEEKLIGLVSEILYAANTWEMDTAKDETERLFNVFGKYSTYIGKWMSEPEVTRKLLSDFADKLPLEAFGIEKEFITKDIFGWIQQNYDQALAELREQKEAARKREDEREKKRNEKEKEISIKRSLFQQEQAEAEKKDLEEEEADRLEEERDEKARKEKQDRLSEEQRIDEVKEKFAETTGKILKYLSFDFFSDDEDEEKKETEEDKRKRLREERSKARENSRAERNKLKEEKEKTWKKEIEEAGNAGYSFVDRIKDNMLLTGKENDLISFGVIKQFSNKEESGKNAKIKELSDTQNELLHTLHVYFRDSREKIGRYINRNLGGEGTEEKIENVPYYRESNITQDERQRRIDAGKKQLKNIIKNSMVGNEGEGQFLRNVLSEYIAKSSTLDVRCMLASAIRNARPVKIPENATREQKYKAIAPMLGGLFKGAGPLFQKILQGMPQSMIPQGLEEAFEDTKSRLDPIPQEIVEAQLLAMVEKSGGAIERILPIKSLGAASVGQAFLCTMHTANGHKDVVIKLLRPDVRNRMLREKKIMESCASEVGKGMKKTYEGLLTRYLEELDLTIEARNTALGSIYNIDGKVSAMKVSNLASPTPGSLVVSMAPGDTAVDVLKKSRKFRDELLGKFYQKDKNGKLIMDGENPRLNIGAGADVQQTRVELSRKLSILREQQKMLCTLAERWVTEAVFGKGYYHGDLHSGNIMLSEKECTVIDFGNATVLDEFQQEKITQMLMAAAAGSGDGFYEGYTALLGEDSRRLLGTRKAELMAVFDEVMKLGDYQSTAERIAAALVRAQKLGFELPPAIYGFQQCQIRLQNTIEDFNAEIAEMLRIINQLQDVEDNTLLDIKARYDKEASERSNNINSLKMVILPNNREDLRCLLRDKEARERLDSIFNADYRAFDINEKNDSPNDNALTDYESQLFDAYLSRLNGFKAHYQGYFSKVLDSASLNQIFKDVGFDFSSVFGEQKDNLITAMHNYINDVSPNDAADEARIKKQFSKIFTEFNKTKDNTDGINSIAMELGAEFARLYKNNSDALKDKKTLGKYIENVFIKIFDNKMKNLDVAAKKQMLNALRDELEPYNIVGALNELWEAQDNAATNEAELKKLEDKVIDCLLTTRDRVLKLKKNASENEMKKNKDVDISGYKQFYDESELFATIKKKLTEGFMDLGPKNDYLVELDKEMKPILEKAINKDQITAAYEEYKNKAYDFRDPVKRIKQTDGDKKELGDLADKLINALRVPVFLSLADSAKAKKTVKVDQTAPETFVDVMSKVINANWFPALRRVNLLKAISYGVSIQGDINGQELSGIDVLSLVKRLIKGD